MTDPKAWGSQAPAEARNGQAHRTRSAGGAEGTPESGDSVSALVRPEVKRTFITVAPGIQEVRGLSGTTYRVRLDAGPRLSHASGRGNRRRPAALPGLL